MTDLQPRYERDHDRAVEDAVYEFLRLKARTINGRRVTHTLCGTTLSRSTRLANDAI